MTDVGTEESSSDPSEAEGDIEVSESGIAWTSETTDEEAESPFGSLAGALATKAEESQEDEAADERAQAEDAEPESSDDESSPAEVSKDDEPESSDDGPSDADSPEGTEAEGAVAEPDSTDDDAESEAEEAELEEEVEPEPPISPFDLPGDWYVIHSYSGYEKKVKLNLATRASSMHMEDRIFEVVIPMETVIEIKGGRKVEVPKKMFPGYILVRMYLDDDTWYAVRNTPGVTAFVGSGTKPTPLSRREVERFLGVKKEEEKKAPRFKPLWDIGEVVRVVDGPFADFNGVIEDINIDQQKVKVLVEIFGRDTPMELNFEQIQKH